MQHSFESASDSASAMRPGDASARERVYKYLARHEISIPPQRKPMISNLSEKLAADVFDRLTHRQFCYLGRSKARRYRPHALELFERNIGSEEPISLYYDLGGGYHAGLRPGADRLRFTVGLGEWFVLGQIARFIAQLTEIYPPGGRFEIIIDNLCARAVNDIPVQETKRYVESLRGLIDAAGLSAFVGVLAESEEFTEAEYLDAVASESTDEVTAVMTRAQLENIHRFLGRQCSAQEARERARKYVAATRVSDRFLEPLVRGLRMTQRATPGNLSFRPYPGGDSRIQTGQVVLTENLIGKIRPMLLTSTIVDKYYLVELDFPGKLGRCLDPVIFARPDRRRRLRS